MSKLSTALLAAFFGTVSASAQVSNNSANSTQSGNQNTALLTQTGASTAQAFQFGHENVALVEQSGTGNTALAVASGSDNEARIFQGILNGASAGQSTAESSTINQVGGGNLGISLQGHGIPTSGNASTISQVGDDNRAGISQGALTNAEFAIVGLTLPPFVGGATAANDGEASVTQLGNGNTAGIGQTLDGNVATTTQNGADNLAMIFQNGAANEASIEEIGDRNDNIVIQQSGNNEASLFTIGFDNVANVLQQAPLGGNVATILIQGDDNVANTVQLGSDNHAFSDMSGSGLGALPGAPIRTTSSASTLSVTQAGSSNQTSNYIAGAGNLVDINQAGSFNEIGTGLLADGVQVIGDGNDIRVSQDGTNLQADVNVTFDDNQVTVNQFGENHMATVNIAGSNNTTTIIQF